MKTYYHKLLGAANVIKVRLIEGCNVYYKDMKGVDRVMRLDYFTAHYESKKNN